MLANEGETLAIAFTPGNEEYPIEMFSQGIKDSGQAQASHLVDSEAAIGTAQKNISRVEHQYTTWAIYLSCRPQFGKTGSEDGSCCRGESILCQKLE